VLLVLLQQRNEQNQLNFSDASLFCEELLLFAMGMRMLMTAKSAWKWLDLVQA